jgi:magnesium transporter
MPFKAYYMSPEGGLKSGLNEEEVRAAFQSEQGLLWVDIYETTEADGDFLARNFNFHHLAIEDCVSPLIRPPKIDDFGSYLFLVVHGINHMGESDIVETTELAFFLGPHYVISNHNNPMYGVDYVIRMVEDDGRPMRRGADFLAHALIDTLVDNVLPTIDKMSDFAETVEEEVIKSPQQATLEAIMKLKRSVIRVHRVMAPQRDIVNRLSRREFPLIREEALVFYRDVYDHIVRIEDMGQSLHDRADNALSTYLSSVANRQNEAMKVLTTVATIFMPLTLLAGIYGMNFEHMPELKWQWGYFAVLIFIGVAIVFAVSWFWARRWLAWTRRRVFVVHPFAVDPEKLKGYIGYFVKRPRVQK